MTHLTRRACLFAFAALAAPRSLRAQGSDFAAALDRAQSLDQIHALVIAIDGDVVAGEALRGPSLDTPVNVKSVSKTVVAALTGIAIARGELPGVAATIGEVAPDLVPDGAAPGVAGITVENLLTLQAGLERTSGGNYGPWVASADWVADALGRPFVAEPGERMLYSTGSTHVLGALLSEVSGQSLLDLARERLGQPLDIAIPPWTRDPQGRYMGGNEMALSPLALVRFGEAYRAGLGGAIPEGWAEASWMPRTRSRFSGDAYGYGWFLREMGGHRAAYARGYGGQMLWVVPSLRLTVVATSDPTRPARSEGHAGALHALMSETILPEAERRA